MQARLIGFFVIIIIILIVLFPQYGLIVAGGAAAAWCLVSNSSCAAGATKSLSIKGGDDDFATSSTLAGVATGRPFTKMPLKHHHSAHSRRPFQLQRPVFAAANSSDQDKKDAEEFADVFMNEPNNYKTEAAVRAMFNKYVSAGSFEEVKGSSKKLPWLTRYDDTVGEVGLDFDGYNEKLKLAFEYQGPLHYAPSRYMKSGQFERLLANDRSKRTLAATNNVHLIILHHKIETKNLMDYVKSRLAEVNCLRSDVTYNKIGAIPEPHISEQTYNKKEVNTMIYLNTSSRKAEKVSEIAGQKQRMEVKLNKPQRGREGFTRSTAAPMPTSHVAAPPPRQHPIPPPGFGQRNIVTPPPRQHPIPPPGFGQRNIVNPPPGFSKHPIPPPGFTGSDNLDATDASPVIITREISYDDEEL